MFRFLVIFFVAVGWPLAVQANGERVLRVAVLENSPPMSYRDEKGELTGFTVGVIKAICAEMSANCVLQAVNLDQAINVLVNGQADIAAVNLLSTPERRSRIVFAKPYFRSVSLWFAKPGVVSGATGARVAVVRGSVQESFALSRHWRVVQVSNYSDVLPQLLAGKANAALTPMSFGFDLIQKPEMEALGLSSRVFNAPGLGGDVSFGIAPGRAALKGEIDAALERIKRNGVYDRLNSLFLPFRVN